MASGTIGSPVGNTIVPVVNLCKQTKQLQLTIGTPRYHDGSYHDISAGLSIVRASGVFYADSAGIWRLAFNIRVSFSAVTGAAFDLPITGVTFSSAGGGNNYQSISGFSDPQAVVKSVIALSNTSRLQLEMSASLSNATSMTFSGDVELASEPTAYTIAANMENSQQIAAYIPSASASSAGLVDTTTQTFEGAKTFKSGLYCDDAAGQSLLSYYAEMTNVTTAPQDIGDGGSPSGLIKATRIGNVVTVSIRITTGNTIGSTPYWAAGTIPAAFCPTTNTRTVCDAEAGEEKLHKLLIGSAGGVYMYGVDIDGNGDLAHANLAANATYVFTISYVSGV